MHKTLDRRDFLKLSGAAAALAATGCATNGGAKARVVVIGGGFGGATAAKYIRMWGPTIEVVLVERNTDFVSCPISNLVLGGSKTMADITDGYDGLRALRRQGRTRRGDRGRRRRQVRAARPRRRPDVRPPGRVAGHRFHVRADLGLRGGDEPGRVLHAWKAGPQTVALRDSSSAMPDGGVYALSIPQAPYRCPPGPYERASMVAQLLQEAQAARQGADRSTPTPTSPRRAVVQEGLGRPVPGHDRVPRQPKAIGVDAGSNVVKLEFEDVKGDVLNVVPPQRAGDIARKAGLITANDRWCDVDWRTLESTVAKGVHVLGDATLSAPGMPKSGHMANQQAKVCAAAVVAMINGREPNPDPKIVNMCYSYVSDDEVIHVTSVHELDEAKKTFVAVKGAGGLSAARNTLEAKYAWAWAQNIWSDTLG